MSSSWLPDLFNDAEIEVANTMLQLAIRPVIKPVVPRWGFKRRRSAIDIEDSPPLTTNHNVASQVENSVCDHDVKIEENSSEVKVEAATSPVPGFEVEPRKTSCNSSLRIRFKLPKPEKYSPGIEIKDVNQTFRAKEDYHPEDVMDTDSGKKTYIKKRGLRKIKEELTSVLLEVHNPIIPQTQTQRKSTKRKSKEEMEIEVILLEDHKASLSESLCKVKGYLEMQKALNLQLKECKLRLSSSELEISN